MLSNPSLPHVEVVSLCIDSRMCTEGTLFFCLRGANVDGHTFAQKAYAAGCRLFCAERTLDLPSDAVVAIVPDTTEALAAAADNFYHHPSLALRVIAVTGTKGKTTTALMAQHLLNNNGISCGYIGTCGIRYGNVCLESANTTPDSLTLQKTMRDMLDAGITALCLEVSSQAVKMKRIAHCHFDVAVMTNFSPDHIGPGEHETLDEYLACKTAILTTYGAKIIIVNRDDEAVWAIGKNSGFPCISFSTKAKADFTAGNVTSLITGTGPAVTFSLRHNHTDISCMLPIPGEINVSNALAALCIATSFGIVANDAAASLKTIRIPGRFETYTSGGVTIVIDYAHNGASLAAALSTLRPFCTGKLIAVFGSVGERTQIRRTELGAAATAADRCILTADNPGEENPLAITAEIADAIGDACPVLQIANRDAAIRKAIADAVPGDVILLAGKGHETYQLIGKQKIPFCERDIVLSALKTK